LKNAMAQQREIIGGGELKDHPGHWKMTGRTEGESESWDVIRKPDGTYWEIDAMHFFPPGGGNVRFDIGKEIVDASVVEQLEDYYDQLRNELEERRRLAAFRLSLRPIAKIGSSSDMRQWKDVFEYKVEGLPLGDEALIARFGNTWQILRTADGVRSGWTGEYASADEALRDIAKAVCL
jgi:hypothetical protein